MTKFKEAAKRITENPAVSLTAHKMQDMMCKVIVAGFAALAIEIVTHHGLRMHRKWRDMRNAPRP